MKTKMMCVILVLAALVLALAACGGESPKTADLQQVYGQMQQQLDLPEMIELAPSRMQRNYGFDGETCPQAIVALCAEGLQVDEIWLIEAPDEETAKQIQTTAESHVQQLCAELENYLPDQYAVAQAARTVRIGNYVGLFISPDAEQLEEIFRQGFEG